MQLKIKSIVDAEGNLHLQVTKNLANQELEVIIIYEESDFKNNTPTPEELGYPSDFFEKTAGKWEGEPLERGDQGVGDERIWDLL